MIVSSLNFFAVFITYFVLSFKIIIITLYVKSSFLIFILFISSGLISINSSIYYNWFLAVSIDYCYHSTINFKKIKHISSVTVMTNEKFFLRKLKFLKLIFNIFSHSSIFKTFKVYCFGFKNRKVSILLYF